MQIQMFKTSRGRGEFTISVNRLINVYFSSKSILYMYENYTQITKQTQGFLNSNGMKPLNRYLRGKYKCSDLQNSRYTYIIQFSLHHHLPPCNCYRGDICSFVSERNFLMIGTTFYW